MVNHELCDYYKCRCWIEMDECQKVVDFVGENNENVGLAAVRLYALYKMQPSKDNNVLGTLEMLNHDHGSNVQLRVMSGFIYGNEQKYSDAFTALENGSRSLECMAVAVDLYLKMDRPELGRKKVAEMKSMEEDAILTQISMAWVDVALGSTEKCDEAAFTFQELRERFGMTSLLLNGGAVAHMMGLNYPEVERLLDQAMEMNKVTADTIVNCIVLCTLTHKLDQVEKHTLKLKSMYPKHPFLASQSTLQDTFNKVASEYH